MLSEEQLNEIIQEKAKAYKDAKGLPDFGGVYAESVEMMNRIQVHAQLGNFPEHLFRKRAPNQTDIEFEYLRENFRTLTFSVWMRYAGVITRMWNDANWSIKWPSEWPSTIKETELPQSYFEKEYPIYDSLETYYKDIVTPYHDQDSNGVIAHKPYSIPTTIVNDEIVVDQSKLIDPIAVYYTSKQLVGWQNNEYAVILLDEKSIVQKGGKNVREGLIFEVYDDTNIYRVTQVGDKNKGIFETIIYYPHNLGFLPVRKMKGRPIAREGGELYQSCFLGAVEHLDCVLLDGSYLMACKAAHAFPQKWSYGDECDYQDKDGQSCISGKLQYDGKDVNCPSCMGTGKKKPSVLGEVIIKTPSSFTPDQNLLKPPFFGWESPDPTILEFLRKEMNINTEAALSMLNLSVSNSEVKGGETALGKQIDREELFSFIKFISDQIFSLYEFSYKCLMQMRYGKDVALPEISYPKTFAIRNEYDLTQEIADAKEKGLPDVAIRALLVEYLLTRFSNQGDFAKIIDIAFNVDRLVTLSSVDIAQKKAAGTIAAWEDILHTSIYSFITEAASKDKEFMNKTVEEQKKIITDMAKAKAKEISNMPNPDDILASANGGEDPLNTPTDVEAEAKAKLKGSVGGVQGIIQIQQSVASGVTDYEAAVVLLFEIYGFDDTTARKLLGDKKELENARVNANAGSNSQGQAE